MECSAANFGYRPGIGDEPRAITCTLTGWADILTELFTPASARGADDVLSTWCGGAGAGARRCAAAGLDRDHVPLDAEGTGATAYADAVATVSCNSLDRSFDRHSTLATWDSSPSKLQLRNTFSARRSQ